ncbi:MAG: ParB/RepB/Spo0J family partition protein [Pyrinomonadaceae bacterium]
MSALLSDSPTTPPNESLQEIDIDLIESNPSQPRTHFDEGRLEELSQSIKSNGIVQPLLLRRVGGKYQLVAGERRWRAAQLAGLQRVPAVVRDIPDEKMLELALIENIQRQELNAIEEAQAYKRLIETLGLTQETVAQRVGRDRSFITNYLRLLRLPEEIQTSLVEEKLSVGHARALLGLEDQEAQKKIAQSIIDKSLSVRETEKLIKNLVNGRLASDQAPEHSVNKQNDANFRAAESKLRRRLSTQVRITQSQSGEGGKIEIEYYSGTDLDRLYQIIVGSSEAQHT